MAKQRPKIKGIFEKNPGSGVWWCRYADSSGKIRREKAGTREAAGMLLVKRRADKFLRKKLPESLRQREVRFGELIDDALEYSRKNKRSYPDDKNRLEIVRGWFGEVPASEVRRPQIEAKLEGLQDRGLAPATVNRFRSLVSMIFRVGIEHEKAETNPAKLCRFRTEDNQRRRYLSQAEEERLRAVIREHWPEHEADLDIALHTGLRRGSMYRLTWEDVDFEHRVLREIKPKKGKVRFVPLNPVAVNAFLELHRCSDGTGRVFSVKKPRHWFEKAIARAGIVDFTWHDLRHTFASRLTMLGVPLQQVMELMGHSSIQMTARYSHLAPGFAGDALAKLASFGKPSDKVALVETDTKTGTAELRIN
jgi:integrase